MTVASPETLRAQFTAALEERGARCVAIDLDRADIGAAAARGLGAAWADARKKKKNF